MAPPRKPAIITSQMVGSRVKHVLRLDMSRSALLPNERRLIWTGRPQIPLSPPIHRVPPEPDRAQRSGDMRLGGDLLTARRDGCRTEPAPRGDQHQVPSVGARTGATDYAPTQTRATRLRRRSEAVSRSTVNPAPRWQAKQGRRYPCRVGSRARRSDVNTRAGLDRPAAGFPTTFPSPSTQAGSGDRSPGSGACRSLH